MFATLSNGDTMGQEYPGYFQDDFDNSNYVAPDPDFPSELGGTASDWNPNDALDFSDYGGSYGEDEAGAVAGPDLNLGGGSLGGYLDSLGDLASQFGLDPTQGGGLFPGGGGDGMADISLDAGGLVPYRRGIPWGPILRMVGAAVRYFGPQLTIPIVNAIAQAWSARLGVTLTPGAVLMRYLGKKGRKRSARGITGRQLTITRRTIGKVERAHQLIRSTAVAAGVNRGRGRGRVTCIACRSSPCRCRRRR
jgi:hypothetical protein